MITISNPEKYVVGILVRLSNERKEDLKIYGESGSITNQKNLLNNFCKENHLKVYKIYIDDGESGAFYDRPGFQEMINDIDAGHINMVVVKDLSRFRKSCIRNRRLYWRIFSIKRCKICCCKWKFGFKNISKFPWWYKN